MAGLRGEGINLPVRGDKIGLPPRVFLYTLDQIAVMLDVSEVQLGRAYIFFEGRSIGRRQVSLMTARNIAPADDKPDWRVAEREFVRWMKVKGFRYYDRGAVSN